MLNIDITKVPYLKTKIPGPKSSEILAEQQEYETRSLSYPKAFPIAIKSTNGSVIEDVDGNLFIDWLTEFSQRLQKPFRRDNITTLSQDGFYQKGIHIIFIDGCPDIFYNIIN